MAVLKLDTYTKRSASRRLARMLFFWRNEDHRLEASYHGHADVDYDADYVRIGRVEKQLERQQKFPTHRRKPRAVGFLFYAQRSGEFSGAEI
jgi:hypothetical protein